MLGESMKMVIVTFSILFSFNYFEYTICIYYLDMCDAHPCKRIAKVCLFLNAVPLPIVPRHSKLPLA